MLPQLYFHSYRSSLAENLFKKESRHKQSKRKGVKRWFKVSSSRHFVAQGRSRSIIGPWGGTPLLTSCQFDFEPLTTTPMSLTVQSDIHPSCGPSVQFRSYQVVMGMSWETVSKGLLKSRQTPSTALSKLFPHRKQPDWSSETYPW